MASGAVATFNGACFGVVIFFYGVVIWRRWLNESRLRASVKGSGVGESLLSKFGARLPWSDRFLFADFLLYVAHFGLLSRAITLSGEFDAVVDSNPAVPKLVFASRVIAINVWIFANIATGFFLIRLISNANEHYNLTNVLLIYNFLASILATFLTAYSCLPDDVYVGYGDHEYTDKYYFWIIAVIPIAIFDAAVFFWFLPQKFRLRKRQGQRRMVWYSFLPRVGSWPLYILYTYFTWHRSTKVLVAIILQIGFASMTIALNILPLCRTFLLEFKGTGMTVHVEGDEKGHGSTSAKREDSSTNTHLSDFPASLKSTASAEPILSRAVP